MGSYTTRIVGVYRCLMLLSGILFGWMAGPSGVGAQEFCAPLARGVPGKPGAPQWWETAPDPWPEINDPRWVGATRKALTGDDIISIRGLNKDNQLYLSLHVGDNVGWDTGMIGDAVFLGFSDGTNHRIVQILIDHNVPAPDGGGWPPTDTACTASAAGICFHLSTYMWNSGTSTWDVDDVLGTTYINNAGLWLISEPSNNPFEIQLRIDLATLGMGTSFQFYTAFFINQGGMMLDLDWPAVMGPLPPGATLDDFRTNIPIPTVDDPWASLTLGTASAECTGGISISRYNIGIDNGSGSLSSQIDIVAGHTNTFAAHPDYGSIVDPTNLVKATFRIANWGSIADPAAPWNDIEGATDIHDSDYGPADGILEWVCENGGTPPTACPTPPPTENHQCMLVTLDKGDGVTLQLDFSKDSVYRNMNFDDSSVIERAATIDLKNLKPLENIKKRDVYLHVITKNMPAHGNKALHLPTKEMFLVRHEAENPKWKSWKLSPVKGRQPQKLSAAPMLKKHLLSRPAKPNDNVKDEENPNELPPYPDADLSSGTYIVDKVESVWPTFKVQVYYATGEHYTFKGKKIPRIKPAPSFGIHAYHQGALYGWENKLESQGGKLEEIVPNFYRLKVVQKKALATLKVRVESKEEPIKKDCTGCPPGPGQPSDCSKEIEQGIAKRCGKCCCSTPGAQSKTGWKGLIALSLVGLFLLLRRRRK